MVGGSVRIIKVLLEFHRRSLEKRDRLSMIFRFRDSWNFLELESEMNVPFRES